MQLALTKRRPSFSREIIQAVKEAEDRIAPEGNGLGVDAFLPDQDPDLHYIATNVRLNGDKCWVKVYGSTLGSGLRNPSVVPELIFKDRRWVFVNFHYPRAPSPKGNLLDWMRSVQRYPQRRE